MNETEHYFKLRKKEREKYAFVIWFCHSLSSLTPNWLLSLSFSDHITSYNTCTHNTHIHITLRFWFCFSDTLNLISLFTHQIAVSLSLTHTRYFSFSYSFSFFLSNAKLFVRPHSLFSHTLHYHSISDVQKLDFVTNK